MQSVQLGLVPTVSAALDDAELHRLHGELLPASRDQDRESSFRRALDLSREQGAKLFELRASVSLAQLWRKDKRSPEARAVLEPIYEWFTEGLATPDLKAARALLDELR
jgi:predicted ATPase